MTSVDSAEFVTTRDQINVCLIDRTGVDVEIIKERIPISPKLKMRRRASIPNWDACGGVIVNRRWWLIC